MRALALAFLLCAGCSSQPCYRLITGPVETLEAYQESERDFEFVEEIPCREDEEDSH